MRIAALFFVTACGLADFRVDAGTDGSADDAIPPAPDGGGTYRQLVLDDQPLAYFRLGESSAASIAQDEAFGPAGTYSGAITFSQPGAIAGDPNTAIALAGGHVDVGDYFPFTGVSPFTVEAWVQSGGSSTYQEIVIKRDYAADAGGGQFGWHLEVDLTGAACLQRWSGTTNESACSSPLPSNAYTHVVGTYDGATLCLYIQGTLVKTASSTQPLSLTTSNLRIGDDVFFSSRFNGPIDEVAIYDHALSAARIAEHTKVGTGS